MWRVKLEGAVRHLLHAQNQSIIILNNIENAARATVAHRADIITADPIHLLVEECLR